MTTPDFLSETAVAEMDFIEKIDALIRLLRRSLDLSEEFSREDDRLLAAWRQWSDALVSDLKTIRKNGLAWEPRPGRSRPALRVPAFARLLSVVQPNWVEDESVFRDELLIFLRDIVAGMDEDEPEREQAMIGYGLRDPFRSPSQNRMDATDYYNQQRSKFFAKGDPEKTIRDGSYAKRHEPKVHLAVARRIIFTYEPVLIRIAFDDLGLTNAENMR